MLNTPASSVITEFDAGLDFDLEIDDSELSQHIDNNFIFIEEGEIINATVVDISRDFVTVNVGYKSKGMIPVSEFNTFKKTKPVEIGDEIEVFLENRENYEGQIVVSRDKAQKLRMWQNVKEIHEKNDTVEGQVISKIKGGLVVDIGIKAFLPGSQVDLRPIRNLDKLIGETFEFKILKYSLKRGNIVLSRRAYLEVDREDRRKKTIETLQEGTMVKGHVKNITDYGVFVDLGGIDGLLHITDITWGRIIHPSEAFNVGDEVEVIILSYDEGEQKVSLGYKQKSRNPWDNIAEKYKEGDHVKGKVVNIMNYGIFIEIEGGIEGLIHISEMSWTKKIKHPSFIVEIGDYVEAIIKEISMEKKRISLSMKDLQPNPWKEVIENNPLGTVVTGKVKNITDFGIFVEIAQGVDGLVHVSDISWSQRLKKISDLFQKNMEIQVKILGVDIEKGRLALGVKQLTEDPWESLENQISVGDEVQGVVVHIADFGIFVEIKDGVEGLIHSSDIAHDTTKKQLMDKFPIGQKIFSKVIKIDAKERKLGLSLSTEDEHGGEYEYTTEYNETIELTAGGEKKEPVAEHGETDSPAEDVSAQTSQEAPLNELSEEAPSAEETEETPSAEASDETPSAEASEESPAAEVTDETPSAEVSEESPAAELTEETPSTEVSEETESDKSSEDKE